MRLLERDAPLASLDGCLADAAAGRGSLVLVTGEAGIGKSALVRAFGAGPAARAAAARVWFGGCEALRTPRPLGPLRDIARVAGGELAELVAAEAARHRIFAAFLDLLGGRPPAVAVFEDVHWADDATLDLLLFVGRRIVDAPSVVVATFRADEIGRDHPLQMVLGDLATAGTIRRLRVEPLSRSAVADLAEPAGLDPDRVHALTGGNAFFVTEVVATPDQAVPPSVRDAVLARAARLTPAARSVLDVAATVPDHVEVALLLAAAGVGSSALDECIRAGILHIEDAAVRFRHELARVAFEQAIPDGHQAGIHARILAQLTAGRSAATPSTVDLARLAYHADEAGDAEAVLAHAPAAAQQAAALGAHRAAAAHYAQALRHADRLPAAERAELWERLAAEQACIADTSESIEAASRALALWREVGDREREALIVARSAGYLWANGQVATAHTTAEEAVALLADTPPGPTATVVYSYLAMLRMLGRDFTGAITAGHAAIELAERFPEPLALSRALNSVGSAQWFVAPDEAPATMRRCLEVARASGDDVATCGAMNNFGSGPGEVRIYDVADHWLRQTIAFAAERDLDTYRLYGLAWLARIQFEQGNWSEATDLVTEAIGRWPTGPPAPVPEMTRVPNADRVALTVLGRLRARRGDPDPDTPLTRAWELAVQTGDLQRLWPVAAARAERAWLAGRPEAVAPLVADSFDLAARLGHPWAVGELAYWLWKVDELTDPPAGAAEPYAAQIAGEPERAARLWTELGCPYEAAIALAEADDQASVLRALTELNRLGAWPAAEQLSQRLRQLGVRRLPRRPRRATLEHPARLTAREIEILDLLPAGLRNADIAARLHISPKTVDHHVSAILAKLGVASRREAAEWASRHAESGEHPGDN
jgi:DNA-binding CsgD family transcriptional regulator/tetratricopeptide (TPR) repeat protein